MVRAERMLPQPPGLLAAPLRGAALADASALAMASEAPPMPLGRGLQQASAVSCPSLAPSAPQTEREERSLLPSSLKSKALPQTTLPCWRAGKAPTIDFDCPYSEDHSDGMHDSKILRMILV